MSTVLVEKTETAALLQEEREINDAATISTMSVKIIDSLIEIHCLQQQISDTMMLGEYRIVMNRIHELESLVTLMERGIAILKPLPEQP